MFISEHEMSSCICDQNIQLNLLGSRHLQTKYQFINPHCCATRPKGINSSQITRRICSHQHRFAPSPARNTGLPPHFACRGFHGKLRAWYEAAVLAVLSLQRYWHELRWQPCSSLSKYLYSGQREVGGIIESCYTTPRNRDHSPWIKTVL